MNDKEKAKRIAVDAENRLRRGEMKVVGFGCNDRSNGFTQEDVELLEENVRKMAEMAGAKGVPLLTHRRPFPGFCEDLDILTMGRETDEQVKARDEMNKLIMIKLGSNDRDGTSPPPVAFLEAEDE